MIIPLYVHSWFQLTAARRRLAFMTITICAQNLFQLTAARRRLGAAARGVPPYIQVSTHSRPKAAGILEEKGGAGSLVSTHSRPKAAGFCAMRGHRCIRVFQLTAARRRLVGENFLIFGFVVVSTHSRPKAAGRPSERLGLYTGCFNSQPPEGGWCFVILPTF